MLTGVAVANVVRLRLSRVNTIDFPEQYLTILSQANRADVADSVLLFWRSESIFAAKGHHTYPMFHAKHRVEPGLAKPIAGLGTPY